MRIKQSVLLKNARNAVAERVYHDHSLVCAYLTGSLLSDDALLGGCTDIDLICVHADISKKRREIERITTEVHLDIAHYSQSDYGHLRELRQDAWLGSYLCESSIVYHDVQHWFEFTQASVCAQFKRAENILQRSQPLIVDARHRWHELNKQPDFFTPLQVWSYLKAIENAANAIAVLNGPPLTERRFLLTFPDRAKVIRRPGLASGLEDLFYQPLPGDTWQLWLGGMQEAFLEAGKRKGSPPRLNACRLPYYKKAAENLFGQHPSASVWLVLRTWTDAMSCMPYDNQLYQGWLEACQGVSLDQGNFAERLNELDSYLDSVEEALDAWAEENGTTPLTELA